MRSFTIIIIKRLRVCRLKQSDPYLTLSTYLSTQNLQIYIKWRTIIIYITLIISAQGRRIMYGMEILQISISQLLPDCWLNHIEIKSSLAGVQAGFKLSSYQVIKFSSFQAFKLSSFPSKGDSEKVAFIFKARFWVTEKLICTSALPRNHHHHHIGISSSSSS